MRYGNWCRQAGESSSPVAARTPTRGPTAQEARLDALRLPCTARQGCREHEVEKISRAMHRCPHAG